MLISLGLKPTFMFLAHIQNDYNGHFNVAAGILDF